MREIQQRSTLQMTADLIGRATGRSIKLEEALQWTVEEYSVIHYQVSDHYTQKRGKALLGHTMLPTFLL